MAKQRLVFCHDTISTLSGGGGDFLRGVCEFVMQGKVVSTSYVQDCSFDYIFNCHATQAQVGKGISSEFLIPKGNIISYVLHL